MLRFIPSLIRMLSKNESSIAATIHLIVHFIIRNGFWNFEQDLLESLTPGQYREWQPILNRKVYKQQIAQELIYTLNSRSLYQHLVYHYGDKTGDSQIWEKFFKHQGMTPKLAQKSIIDWLSKKGWKRNTLRIRGPASTGKSAFCNVIKELFSCDSISVLDSRNNFTFNDCLHKQIIVWEECYIREVELAQEAKKLFAGDNFHFNRKGENKAKISRVPVLVTSNKEKFGGGMLPYEDEEALNTRCYNFYFQSTWHQDMGILTKQDLVQFLFNKY